ncbi:hypothetical protein JNB63_11065 [Microbacterium trichothecenolyticum]|uniref:hypothetical protein n=1 Tax=Microbacterium trichothecenolyticum TaxID=69370 RepID=UPI001C6ED30C|nr:hypothetical protein [Microbacterium trichothecenolyticum]MBW9120638.1 hypothetical protein [Microbacterium trichothecenolyticum]
MIRATAAALTGVSLLALSGCVVGPGEPQGGPTPAAFLERAELPSCGSVRLGQGEPVPTEDIACLEEATTAGAELAVTRPTTEGDPFTVYYRVLPGGGWEIYTDLTKDTYGEGWWLDECPDALSMSQLGECTNTRL